MSGEKSNIEVMLSHFSNLNARLDKMTEMILKLHSHHTIVPLHTEEIAMLKNGFSEIKVVVQELVYERDKREEIKKSITNPLIMRTLWSFMGIAGCFICVIVGFSYKAIDIKSNVERAKLIGN